MANHQVVTPYALVEKGGYYYMESTDLERKECITYYRANSTWLGYHGCAYQNTTGINYESNQLLCLDDVKLNYTPPTKVVYNFQNTTNNGGALYIRATDIPCCDELSGLSASNWGGANVTIEGGTGSGYTYYPATIYSGNINTAIDTRFAYYDSNHGEYYILNGEKISTSSVLIINAEGTIPYDAYDNMLYNGKSLFNLCEYITLDFNGENCKNKYFSFFVGLDELAVKEYGQGHIPSGQYQFGWSAGHLVGYGDKRYLNNATHIYSDFAGEEKIYDYKSVKHIYTSAKGFTVVFNNTTNTNSICEETIVVGYDLDNNTWNTTSRGLIFKCKNFTMS